MYFDIVSNWIALKTVFIMSWHLILYISLELNLSVAPDSAETKQ